MNANKCAHFHTDCFHALGAHCKLLTQQIDKPDCPFYKTEEEMIYGRKESHQHLIDIGRNDLINKYEYNSKRTW